MGKFRVWRWFKGLVIPRQGRGLKMAIWGLFEWIGLAFTAVIVLVLCAAVEWYVDSEK